MRAPGSLRKGVRSILGTLKKAFQRICGTELSFIDLDSHGTIQTEKWRRLIMQKWHEHQPETWRDRRIRSIARRE